MYKLFVFPNMVLGKTEYSNAVNVGLQVSAPFKFLGQLIIILWCVILGIGCSFGCCLDILNKPHKFFTFLIVNIT